MPKSNTLDQFKNKVRVRVCGILEIDAKILLIKHEGLKEKELWLPPGGGVEFGETLEQALIREFEEETKLIVTVTGFAGINEYIKDDLHAIELFYFVSHTQGKLVLGSDPELDKDNQILTEIKFLNRTQAQKHLPIPL